MISYNLWQFDSLAGGLAATDGGLGSRLAGLVSSGSLLAGDNNAALLARGNADSLFNSTCFSNHVIPFPCL